MTSHPLPHRPRVGLRVLAPVLGSILLLGGLLAAQALQPAKSGQDQKAEGGDVQLFFSPDAASPKLTLRELSLRPNVAQQLYLYVENKAAKDPVTVELRVGGKAIASWTSKQALPKNEPVKVLFSEKPPQPNEKPPELTVVAGPMEAVALVGSTVTARAPVRVARPSEYVKVNRIQFNGESNTLSVEVVTNPDRPFIGPPARVELVLLADRIPALVKGQKKDGSYGGWLTPNEPLKLVASKLRFTNLENRSGLVYLTIDGYPRAFTYRATFATEGLADLDRIDLPIMGLNTTGLAMAGAPSKVGLEIDNLYPDTEVELGLFRNSAFTDLEGKLERHTTERDEQVFFNPLGPNGALLFRTVVTDWQSELQTADIFGERVLRLKVNNKGKPDLNDAGIDRKVWFIDSGKPIRVDKEGNYVLDNEITRSLWIDGSPPENVDFLNFPKQLVRGSDLPVKATGADPESGIARVVFFIGKPQDDGKIPPTAPKVEIKPANKDVKVFEAQAKLPAPTEKKGTFDVSVAYINGVGMETIKTVQIELVDAKAAAGGATITGMVVFGDTPIPGQEVLLRDPQGNVKDTTKTSREDAARGVFVFKNVAPGTYQIVAVNTALRATGQAAVQVGAGEDKKLAEPITLRR